MKFENVEIGGRRFMVARGELSCPGYMPEMIMKNAPASYVPFSFMKKEGSVKVLYETDTYIRLKEFLTDNGADEHWIRNFLISMDGMLALCGEFLIDPDFIMIDAGSIFLSPDSGLVRYIFNPFEINNFKGDCKKLLAEIAGNYFMDHGVSGEVFRERFLREVVKRDFNIRNLLARWEDLSYGDVKMLHAERQTNPDRELKRNEVFKGLFNKLNKKADDINATTAVSNVTGHMCLTGICSINTKIPIREEGVTVGRGMLQKNYGLYNSGIGKVHARVYEQEGEIFAADLGSRNGTYLNGEQLEKRVPVKLERGDILAFSDEEFILC